MRRFVLEKVNELKGPIEFYYLIDNGRNYFKEFIDELKSQGGYERDFNQLNIRLHLMSEMTLMPDTKCKNITPENESIKEYEIKTKNLRVYLVHEHLKGRIIITIGKKTNQSKDIKRFRNLKKEYFAEK